MLGDEFHSSLLPQCVVAGFGSLLRGTMGLLLVVPPLEAKPGVPCYLIN